MDDSTRDLPDQPSCDLPDQPTHDDGAESARCDNRHRPRFVLEWRLDLDTRRRLALSRQPCSTVTALWWCPVCDTPVRRERRPGRHRVYCTNACRQRAYRLRREAKRRRRAAGSLPPAVGAPDRAHTRDRTHAVCDVRDVRTGSRDSVGKGITACGAFARMPVDDPDRHGHTRFYVCGPPRNLTTCRRCEQLLGVPERPHDEVLAEVLGEVATAAA